MAGPEGLGLDTVVIALAGQPNVGKSTIFNVLTGLTQHVGNWPGKTVEQKIGHHIYQNYDLLFVDLPGTYSLSANSEEERIARDYVIRESPDVVVAVVEVVDDPHVVGVGVVAQPTAHGHHVLRFAAPASICWPSCCSCLRRSCSC